MHARLRRGLGHACEQGDGFARLAGGAGLLALLVDRGGLAFDQFAAPGGGCRRQCQRLHIGALGAIERRRLESGVRNHRPGHAALLVRSRRVEGEHALRHAFGAFDVLQRKQLLGCLRQHRADPRVTLEGVAESLRAGDGGLLQGGQLGGGGALLQLRARQQGGVGRVAALGVQRVVVCGLVVLDRCAGEAAVVVEQFGEQELEARGFAVLRERGHDFAVPARGLVDVGRGLALLRSGVVVARQFGQVRLDQRLRRGLPGAVVGAAKLARRAVALHVLLLCAHRQRGQAAAFVDADHARLQHRGLGMQRLASGESAEGVGGILGPVLLDVELAELLVHAKLVRAACVVDDVGRYRLGAAQVGQADAGDAHRVFDQFTVGARQALQGLEWLVTAAGDLQIEHGEEGLQALFEAALLVQRPAVHVQRTVVVRGRGLARGQAGVGLLRLGVLAGVEQQLAATELGLVTEARVRVARDQPVERGQCGFQLAAEFVRTCQLVQHAVVVRVVRVGLQVGLVLHDGGAVVGVGAGIGALVVGAFHRQVADAAQGFGALRRTRRDIEEPLVGRRRLLRRRGGQGLGHRRLVWLRPGSPTQPASARCPSRRAACWRTRPAARRRPRP